MAKRRNRVSLAGRNYRQAPPEADVRSVVLNQPHRRGNTDQRCASVFGRFTIRNKLSQDIYDAGEKYREAANAWRIAKGVPGIASDRRGMAAKADLTADDVEVLRRKMLGMERAMWYAAGHKAYLAVRQLVLDENELGMDQDGDAIDGVTALAIHLGLLTASGSPYAAPAAA
jgi:hypothetical protein